MRLANLLFEDARHIVDTAKTKVIEPEDLLPLPPSQDPRRVILKENEILWTGRWQLFLTLLKSARSLLIPAFVLNLASQAFGLLSPWLVNRLVGAISSGFHGPNDFWRAIPVAFALGLAGFLSGLCLQHAFIRELSTIQVFTSVLNRRIFHHSLRLSKQARGRASLGDIVNHMSADTESLADISIFLIDLLGSLLLIVGAIWMLFHFIGWSALGALVVMAVLTPVTRKAATRFRSLDEVVMRHRDERITLMSQVLNAIRVVKYFVWEKSVGAEVSKVRARELESLRQMARAHSIVSLGYTAVSTLVLFVALLTHHLRGHELDATTVFTCVALFGLLEGPFGNLSQQVAFLANALVGADRIVRFLRQETIELRVPDPVFNEAGVGVELRELSFRYHDANAPVLNSIGFRLEPGASLAVVGEVGAGKSTLLHALLGEVRPDSGGIRFFDSSEAARAPRCAYVPQEAFIINGTLRENIVFGLTDVSEDRLHEALRVSCLDKDLLSWSAGLDTEIGEKGVNLSGGQKQRVSLARAYLQQPQLVLLDDPLSAVDVETESQLVDRLLFDAWSKATRIVATHRLESLERFDRILLIEGGRVSAYGTYSDLLASSATFRHYVEEHQRNRGELHGPTPSDRPVGEVRFERRSQSRITEDEDRETGAVKSSVYLDYLRALSGRDARWRPVHLTLLGLSAVLVSLAPLLQRSWLAHGASGGVSPALLVTVYGVLGLFTLGLALAEKLYWLERAIIAGRDFHDRMLQSVLHAPVRFFDSTPMGRILQRFSRDVESVDIHLQWSFTAVITHTLQVLVALVLIIAVLPLVAVFMAPAMLLYYRLQRDYRVPAREVKRLDSISRSPRYAHFKETLQGLVVIRAFAKGDWFTEGFYDRLAHNHRMFYNHFLLNRWFSARIPAIGGLIAAGTAGGLAFAASRGTVSPGVAGLLTTYSLSFWNSLNWCVRVLSDVEARMTSVERLNFFASIPGEKSTRGDPVAVASDWPARGEVVFDQVQARYAPKLPLVLRGVSFEVGAGTRVGIIGRTGSGKSTLLQALFRFIEIDSGAIRIDGVDISRVPLERLRRSLAIIPQDPTLFIGTIRSNLDPYGEFPEDEILQALEKASLRDFVEGLPGGLDHAVTEGGQNLSQGQRQLLCLSRALLLKARIIVLDEATASVDVRTDALLQKVLQESLQGATLLIIAHRLGTLRDCDQIIEIGDGEVKALRTAAELASSRLESLEVE